MDLILGIVIIFFSLLGWLGQMLTAVSHKHAAKFGLTESESDVDPAFFADVRGEALWDTINRWILPVAGILLLSSVQTTISLLILTGIFFSALISF